MATSQNTNIQSPNLMEQLISSQLLSKLMNDNSSSGNENTKNYLLKMFLFMGMDQFKKLLNGIIDHFLTKLKEFELTKFIYELFQKFINIFRYNSYIRYSLKNNNPVYSIDYELQFNKLEFTKSYKTNLVCFINFQVSFWNNIISEEYKKLIKYDFNEISEAEQSDNYTIKGYEIWEHIKIESDDFNAEFLSDLNVKIESKYNKKTIIHTDNCIPDNDYVFNVNPIIKENKIEDNMKIIIPSIHAILDKRYADKISGLAWTTNLEKYINIFNNKCSSELGQFHDLFNISCKDTKYINEKKSDWNIRVLILIGLIIYNVMKLECDRNSILNKDSYPVDNDVLSYLRPKNRNNAKKLFGYLSKSNLYDLIDSMNDYNLLQPLVIIGDKFYNEKTECKNNEFLHYNLNNLTNQLCELCDIKPFIKINEEDRPKYDLKYNNINLQSNSILDKYELQNKFFEFVSEVSNHKKAKEGNKVKVYSIKIERNEVKKSELNPEYIEWETKLNSLKESLNNSETNSEDNDNQNSPKKAFNIYNPYQELIAKMILSAPSKNLEKIEIKKEIKSTQINEVYKDLSTMYLSKKDKDSLTNIIKNYRDNQDKLSKFGLPNRMGIMLYGLPGCGKSSTIVTIASEMNRNIYYLDMNGIKTNQELAMLFDYVNTQTSEQGIICIEDIDAMNDVFLSRTKESINTKNITSLLNEGETPLTLEFVLNILDGTLTKEGSIVIMTTNYIDKIDNAIYRPGRVNLKIEMRPADHYQISNIFKTFFNRDINEELLKRIPEYKHVPAEFIFHFANYIMVSNDNDLELLEPFLVTNNKLV
jgi:flagellar biosynthesis GTPase FlhF